MSSTRTPARRKACLERRERLVVARARVDQRQRVAAQQPGVDRADVRKRDRDRNEVSMPLAPHAAAFAPDK